MEKRRHRFPLSARGAARQYRRGCESRKDRTRKRNRAILTGCFLTGFFQLQVTKADNPPLKVSPTRRQSLLFMLSGVFHYVLHKSENQLIEATRQPKAASCGARDVRARRLPTNLLRKTSTQGTRAKQPPHAGRLQSRSSSRCKHRHPLMFPRRHCFGHGKASGRCCEAALLSK